MANKLLPPGRSDPLPLPAGYALQTGGGFKNTNRTRRRSGLNQTNNGRQGANVMTAGLGNDPANGMLKDFPHELD